MPERYIAIDNVCAWPNITRLEDGTILAAIFNQPCHGKWEGDVDCYASTDGGRMWKYRGTPAKHEPTTVRKDHAAGVNALGEYMVICSGRTHRNPVGQEPDPESGLDGRARLSKAWVCRSKDAGVTWQVDRDVMPASRDGYSAMVPFGDICVTETGRIGLATTGYHLSEQEHTENYFISSDDHGRTWSKPVVINPDGGNETTVFYMGNDHWLAAARTRPRHNLNLHRSTDGGKTWKHDQVLTVPAQAPAGLFRHSNGWLVLTFGCRCRGQHGIQARISGDQGVTWSPPSPIVTYGNGDGGYPSSVENKDGSIVTMYYANGEVAHRRYHAGVVIWKLEEIFGNLDYYLPKK